MAAARHRCLVPDYRVGGACHRVNPGLGLSAGFWPLVLACNVRLSRQDFCGYQIFKIRVMTVDPMKTVVMMAVVLYPYDSAETSDC